ncbi:UDP-galactose/UDP-glucose transporter 7-like, partial [Camellia sinensis]|uniref:UDP-galactose/UDP-glucose transporter 7-like n=1 Tax=Camellia sinensis TaxID=4442 RepID=UPI0010367F99
FSSESFEVSLIQKCYTKLPRNVIKNVIVSLAACGHTYSALILFQWVILSVVLTAAGVMIAALGDFSFDLVGYSMAFTSVFFQTMYLVLVEKSGAEDGLSSVEIMFYNSFLSLPFLVFLIIATGEFPDSLSLLFAKVRILTYVHYVLILFLNVLESRNLCF